MPRGSLPRSHGRDARATLARRAGWHGRPAHVPGSALPKRTRSNRGSVLIIVMWICFGVVALTLYFANSMSSELRAADNRVVDASARAACDGGVRYAAYLLGQLATGGTVPLTTDYKAEQLPVGDAYFWFIGRDPNQKPAADPFFGIVDEASKINLNAPNLTVTMLSGLPTMTSDVAANILTWRGASNAGGAGNETYARLDPPDRKSVV